MPKDAETWLAEHGVAREPIGRDRAVAGDGRIATPDTAATSSEVPSAARTAPRTDTPVATDAATAGDETVAQALAFIRRSTMGSPQSEGRLRTKMRERGFDDAAAEHALTHARAARLVDDAVIAAAFVDERRRRGHAAARIRRDLLAREFDHSTVEHVLAQAEREDPSAAAFALARERAQGMSGLEPETAFRRIVGHLTRRGHTDGLARAAARQAVFAERETERVAGH